MLKKIERKFIEDVISLTKIIISLDKECKKVIDEQLNECPQGEMVLALPWGIYVNAAAELLPDGLPKKTEYGDFVFEDFVVSGDTLHFVAFCLQEGELRPGWGFFQAMYSFNTDDNRKIYEKDTPDLSRTQNTDDDEKY